MRTKLPYGFTSWIAFYDYINVPNLANIIPEKFVFSVKTTSKETLLKYTRTYIKAKCFEEIEAQRLEEWETRMMIAALKYGVGNSHVDEYRRTRNLLIKISKGETE